MHIPWKLPLRSHSRNCALTLVELLVSIVIVVVIAALLLPTLKALRSRATGATCASNMRNIASAILTYAAENNGHFPPYTLPQSPPPEVRDPGKEPRWPSLFWGDLGRKTFACPLLGYEAVLGASAQHVSYGYNFLFLGSTRGKTRGDDWWVNVDHRRTAKLAQVEHPARTLLLEENLKLEGVFANKAGHYQSNNKWNGVNIRADPRHGRGVLIAWVDGHVSMEETLEDYELPLEWFELEKQP